MSNACTLAFLGEEEEGEGSESGVAARSVIRTVL
jgi:hypothetical protein